MSDGWMGAMAETEDEISSSDPIRRHQNRSKSRCSKPPGSSTATRSPREPCESRRSSNRARNFTSNNQSSSSRVASPTASTTSSSTSRIWSSRRAGALSQSICHALWSSDSRRTSKRVFSSLQSHYSRENVGAPIPKDPPASLMPTPVELQTARPPSPCAAAAQSTPEVQMARRAALEEAKRIFQGPDSAKGVPMAVVRESMDKDRRSIMSNHRSTSIGIVHFMSSLILNFLVVQIQRSQKQIFELSAQKFHR